MNSSSPSLWLEEIDDGKWDVYFGPLKLGRELRIIRGGCGGTAKSVTYVLGFFLFTYLPDCFPRQYQAACIFSPCISALRLKITACKIQLCDLGFEDKTRAKHASQFFQNQ
jgi:uncharacterized membrane protein YhdT